MAYDKSQLQEAGVKLVELILAVADGVGADDLDEGVEFFTAAVGCVDEFKEDFDAALFQLLGAAANYYGDLKREEALLPAQP